MKTSISVDPASWEKFEKRVATEGRDSSAVLEELTRNHLLADLFAGLAEEEVPLVVRPVGPVDAGEEVWRMRQVSSI